MKKYYFSIPTMILFPALSLAATCSGRAAAPDLNAGSASKFGDIVCYVIGLINLLIPILIAGAFVFFFWGLSKYVINAGEKEIKLGKEYMMWGILVIFILLSYRAIIGIVYGEFDFKGTPSQSGVLLPE